MYDDFERRLNEWHVRQHNKSIHAWVVFFGAALTTAVILAFAYFPGIRWHNVAAQWAEFMKGG